MAGGLGRTYQARGADGRPVAEAWDRAVRDGVASDTDTGRKRKHTTPLGARHSAARWHLQSHTQSTGAAGIVRTARGARTQARRSTG
jgi:hypothetical protein